MRFGISYPGPLACGALLVSAMAAFGHGNATGIVGERMMGMMMLSEQIKILGPIADDPNVQDMNAVLKAADMIEMHAGQAMTDLFPEGSTESPSEAKLAIWERWDEFVSYSKRLEELGVELAASADKAASPPIVAETAMEVPAPVLSEWDRMSFASLMGIAPPAPVEVDQITTASIKPAVAVVRPVSEVYSDITGTCAACHAAFRQ